MKLNGFFFIISFLFLYFFFSPAPVRRALQGKMDPRASRASAPVPTGSWSWFSHISHIASLALRVLGDSSSTSEWGESARSKRLHRAEIRQHPPEEAEPAARCDAVRVQTTHVHPKHVLQEEL